MWLWYHLILVMLIKACSCRTRVNYLILQVLRQMALGGAGSDLVLGRCRTVPYSICCQVKFRWHSSTWVMWWRKGHWSIIILLSMATIIPFTTRLWLVICISRINYIPYLPGIMKLIRVIKATDSHTCRGGWCSSLLLGQNWTVMSWSGYFNPLCVFLCSSILSFIRATRAWIICA